MHTVHLILLVKPTIFPHKFCCRLCTQVIGIDSDVSATFKRGLTAVTYSGKPLIPGSLKNTAEAGLFDCVVIYGGSVHRGVFQIAGVCSR